MTLRTSSPRAKPRWALAVAAVAAMTLLVAGLALGTGPVGTASGFEDDDGNLAPEGTINFDWNSFATTNWTGTAPYQESDKVISGWTFKGITDAEATTSDSAFAGGTKQDDNCPTVNTGKAPNKDDLKRIYLSTKVVGGKTYLNLAWVRIPQNTTSPSAHIGFEFNKGTDGPCPGTGSDGLVKRVAGDILIVYDFEGGTGTPVITLRKWVTSGACEVGNSSPPCWGTATNLTVLGYAEAKVNTDGPASDGIAPSPPDALGLKEFGEAGINLTDAGVFTAGTCESFGTAFGVSRSSGNSGTAQMKDLIGPADFQLQNCGSIKIIKQTDPRGLNQSFSFTTTGFGDAGSSLSCITDTSPTDGFSLNDNGNTGKTLGSTDAGQNSTGNTETCSNILPGTYSVTEGTDPSGFAFDSLTCTDSGGNSTSKSTRTATITVAGGGSTTCLYVNKQQLGAIKITKTSTKSENTLAGATFSITKGGTAIAGSPFTTNSSGESCVDGLVFGDYVVTETAAPTGFKIDTTAGQTVTVDNNASCSDTTYVGETKAFTNTPLADIQVNFRDGGSGETALDEDLSCTTSTGTDSTTAATGWDASLTRTGIEVDGQAVITITCTIKIDP